MMDYRTEFTRRMRRYFERSRLTNKEIGERIGYGEAMVSHISTGHKLPEMSKFDALADLLGVPPSEQHTLRGILIRARMSESELKALEHELTTGGVGANRGHAVDTDWVPVLTQHYSGGLDMNQPDGGYAPRLSFMEEFNGVFAVEIGGDDMTPLFQRGAIVLSTPEAKPAQDEPAVVFTDEGILVRMWRETSAGIILDPVNRAHEPIVLKREDIRWAFGVVGYWTRMRSTK